MLISHLSESFSNKCALADNVNFKGKFKTLVLFRCDGYFSSGGKKVLFITKDLELRIVISDLRKQMYNELN